MSSSPDANRSLARSGGAAAIASTVASQMTRRSRSTRSGELGRVDDGARRLAGPRISPVDHDLAHPGLDRRRRRGLAELGSRRPVDHEIDLPIEERADHRVEVVDPGVDRCRGDDAAECEHGDVGGAATDVHHHPTDRIVDRHPTTDRRRDGVLDRADRADPGLLQRPLDRPILHRRLVDMGADDRAEPFEPASTAAGEGEGEDALGEVDIDEFAVPYRPDDPDPASAAGAEAEGLTAERQELAGVGVDRRDGRLLEHHGPVGLDDPGHRGPEIDGELGAHCDAFETIVPS